MENWPKEQSAIVTIIFVLVVLYRTAKRAMRGGVMAVAVAGQQ